eukprot:jgi/Botrbrau1/4212/Bobra.0044s0015.1
MRIKLSLLCIVLSICVATYAQPVTRSQARTSAVQSKDDRQKRVSPRGWQAAHEAQSRPLQNPKPLYASSSSGVSGPSQLTKHQTGRLQETSLPQSLIPRPAASTYPQKLPQTGNPGGSPSGPPTCPSGEPCEGRSPYGALGGGRIMGLVLETKTGYLLGRVPGDWCGIGA